MTSEKILQSNVLDILFENRNKEYGAYDLRVHYNARLFKSVMATLLFLFLLVALLHIKKGHNKETLTIFTVDHPTQLTDVSLPKAKPVEVLPQPKATVQKVATVKDFVPIILPDRVVPKTEVHTVDQLDTSAIGLKDETGIKADPKLLTTQPASTNLGNGPTSIITTTPPITGPLNMGEVDEVPEYPGGKEALLRYMVNSLTSELEPGVKHLVKAQFIINETGQVSEVKILQSSEPILNDQVLKSLRKMKNWKPGFQNGQPVAVKFIMPVTFIGPEE